MRRSPALFSLFLLFCCFAARLAFPQQPGDQTWYFPTGGAVTGSPSLDRAGNVVFGSEDYLAYSITPDRQVNWAAKSNDLITGNIAVTPRGSYVFGSWDGKVYSVDSNGTIEWSYDTRAFISGSPAIAVNGTIYICARDGILYALGPDGSLKWVFVAEGPIHGGAAIGSDGTIYFGDEAGFLHALNPDGSVKWQFMAEAVTDRTTRIRTIPALDRSGVIYFGSGNHYFYALYPNGDLKWKYETGDKNDSSAVIDGEGHVIFACRDGYLYKLTPSLGLPVWTKLIGDVFYASAAVDTDNNLYIAAFIGSGVTRLYAVGPDSSTLWTRNYAGLNDSSPVLSKDGYLYIGFHDGIVYKLYTGRGPSSSIWPMQGRNAARASSMDEAFATAEVAGTWLQSKWFGWLSQSSNDWIYHYEHHWLYAQSKDPINYWYYDTGMHTWCYTSRSYYPYVYFPTAGWAYYLKSTLAPSRWFFNYSDMQWMDEPALKSVLTGG